ncbi:hypothetical protein Tco_0306661 [Tanacetum coccineum]
MISTSSRTRSKKPSELILLPMGILEIVLCMKGAPCMCIQERDSSQLERCSILKDITRISAQKQTSRLQESTLRSNLTFVHFRISTLKTTLEDIQLSSESSSI